MTRTMGRQNRMNTYCSCSWQGIFDGGVLWIELSRQICLWNIFIMRWERVSLQTERADPEFSSHIDLTVACRRFSTTSCKKHVKHCVSWSLWSKAEYTEQDWPVWVQNCSTRWLTRHWFIHDGREVLSLLEWRIKSRYGYYCARCLDSRSGERVPWQAKS